MTRYRNFLAWSVLSLTVGTLGFSALRPTLVTANEPTILAQSSQPAEGERAGRQRPDFAAAAAQLGVSEEALLNALGVPATPPERDANGRPIGDRPARPDFAVAAAQLGVSEEALLNALHPEGRPQPGDGSRQGRRPDLAAAAEQLGISEDALKTALGVPATPPELDADGRPIGDRPARPDFAAAAAQLGISEEALLNALHPEGRPQR